MSASIHSTEPKTHPSIWGTDQPSGPKNADSIDYCMMPQVESKPSQEYPAVLQTYDKVGTVVKDVVPYCNGSGLAIETGMLPPQRREQARCPWCPPYGSILVVEACYSEGLQSESESRMEKKIDLGFASIPLLRSNLPCCNKGS